jgi:hypothetical protein
VSTLPIPSNLRTREQWLHAVLHSGRVSRIGQHLALVLYHLADVTTNIAKMSARDLERITGWSRTAITEHVNELHKLGEFLSVQWGQGRAKSIFELQGVIAEVMAQKKAERDAATTDDATVDATPSGNVADATVDAKPDTKFVASQTDATVATTADTTLVASQDDTKDHRCVRHADTTSEKGDEGGTIGGETKQTQDLSLSHSHTAQTRERAVPDWMTSEDGGFEGLAFELSGADVGGLIDVYQHLEFPAELVAADRFLASQFAKVSASVPMPDRMARLHTYLAKLNRTARELKLSLGLLAANKGQPKPPEPPAPVEPPSCWFDKNAKLQVANGFEAELLQAVGGDPIRLREELDKAGGWIGVNVRGPQLMAKTRSRITDQVKGRSSAAANDTQADRRARIRRHAEEAEAKYRAEHQKQQWGGRR